MNVLIAGGYGFLGGRLSEYLSVLPGYSVTIGSTRPPSGLAVLRQCRYFKIQWSEQAELEKACEHADIVIQAAGLSAEDSVRDPTLALQVNGMHTIRLLQAAVAKKVKRFIYFSTAHVYDSPLTGYIDEGKCPGNLHPYATSHKAAEDAVLYANATRQIEGIVIRLSNSFGYPVDPLAPCWNLLINNLCLQGVRKNEMLIRSVVKQSRNFVSLFEVCRAIQHLIELPVTSIGNGVFNMGSDWNPTLEEAAERIAETAKNKAGVIYRVIRPEQVQRQDGAKSELRYSIAKLAATGYTPFQDSTEQEIYKLILFCNQNNDAIIFEIGS